MRRHVRALVLVAVTALVAAGCSDGGGEGAAGESVSPSASDAPSDGEADGATDGATDGTPDGSATAGDAPTDGAAALPDPNEDIEDGIYRGVGVLLPVPDGWTIDAAAHAQGIVAATSADRNQQMTAQAIDSAAAAEAGQPLELDALVDSLRQQVGAEPQVDEVVEIEGADRAHRLTWLDLPGQEEGDPPSSATIVIAENAQLIGEFVLAASADAYDEGQADLLLAEAGFDPNSDPPAPPSIQAPQQGQSAPAPQQSGQPSTTPDE